MTRPGMRLLLPASGLLALLVALPAITRGISPFVVMSLMMMLVSSVWMIQDRMRSLRKSAQSHTDPVTAATMNRFVMSQRPVSPSQTVPDSPEDTIHPRLTVTFQTVLGRFPQDRKDTPSRLHTFVEAVRSHFYTDTCLLRVHDMFPTPAVQLVNPEQKIAATAKVHVLDATLAQARTEAEKFVRGFPERFAPITFTVTADDAPLSPGQSPFSAGKLPPWWEGDDFRPLPQPPVPETADVSEVTTAGQEKNRRWVRAKERLGAVSLALADFEFDPEAVYFTRPLLRDLTEPATMRFYDAYGDALAMDSDTEPDDDLVDKLVAAVDRAARAWEVADRNARDKAEQHILAGGKPMPPEDIADLSMARKLMNTALNTSSTPAESALSWQKSLAVLDRIGLAAPQSLVASMAARNALVARCAPQLEGPVC